MQLLVGISKLAGYQTDHEESTDSASGGKKRVSIQRLELEVPHFTEDEKFGVVIQGEMAVKVRKTHNTNSKKNIKI